MKRARALPKEPQRIEIARFSSQLEAELARTNLEHSGITAAVIETSPFMGNVAGGVRLFVDAADAETAHALLEAVEPEDETEESLDPDAVRCPRCELPDCRYGRRVFEAHALLVVFLFPVVMILYALHLLEPKRWVCAKCGHDFEDKSQAGTVLTPLASGYPRPVFRLPRTQAVVGFVIGLISALIGSIVLFEGRPSWVVIVAGGLLGSLIGHALATHVCSEPSCRARITTADEECPACHGRIVGPIQRAREHYCAAADYRREIASKQERYRLSPATHKRRRKAEA